MNDWMEWYNSLNKPSWTPSPVAIGAIWTILYPIIFVSYGFVFYKTLTGAIGWLVLAVFSVNLISNLIFTYILFRLKNLSLASLDILIVLITIVLEMILVWPNSKLLALVQIPYLIWVSIATFLQLTIAFSNRQ